MDVNFPKLEAEVLEKWKREKTFEKSAALRQAQGKPRFIFYEGPPTANGRPGIHHVLTRAFKDIILRYKTMRGFLVARRAGWDTHGLAVEIETEKKLGLKSKKDIEQYGIEQFNAECKKSVWEYKQDWENLTERIGFWIDMKNPYITHETSYIETLWQIMKLFWDKKLLYKDYKVVPYCTRCGTPLSSHELAQGYKTVTENAVFVKFLISNSKFLNTYLLAWTTTPWTLLGNVALAVNPMIEYVLAESNGEQYILAKELAGKLLGEYTVLKTYQGEELKGMQYEPLFRFGKPEQGKKIWEVVLADFVSVEDGTGIVHTAVAYGEDDFQLGKKENLAMLHLVNEQGKFKDEVVSWKGMFVKDADPLIIEDLKRRNVLLKEEPYEHEYPFCWRCSTPLLYYAKDSWFINMQKVKEELLANNEKINWTPKHIKYGRMDEWLKGVKDWAFSRERYWGTPLPVWQCTKCEKREMIGSVKELLKKSFSSNKFFILRHGDAERPLDIMSCWPEKKPYHLTQKGKLQIQKVAQELKKKHINLIFSSDFMRTRETAQIIGKMLGTEPILDKRLREFNVGELNGKPITDLRNVWGRPGESELEHYLRRFVDPMPQGESYSDVQRRMYEFTQEINKKYKNKNILVISHEISLTLLEGIMRGFSREEIIHFRKKEKKYLQMGEWRELPFAQLPLDDRMEINLHRPYVDEVRFGCYFCKKGTMERVKEVVDVWFDSGAMPFAQNHWMGGARPQLFPADYIVEGIDQTRGWFYTLLAVSTLLGFGAPYKNVVALSHVLDEKGEKMSKSKGNVVNPWDMVARYGADAVRWYFYTVNNPGDPKLFVEKDIQQATRNFLLTLWNCFVFYDTYRPKTKNPKIPASLSLQRGEQLKSKNILDSWILSRLQGTIQAVTEKLDSYNVTGAGRAIQNFVVNDLSLWYIRRSRSRAKDASATLGFVLAETCKLTAPFIPFLSEHIFQQLGNKDSVHLANWSKTKTRDTKLEIQMMQVRDIVAKALAERAKAGIKVRQPLAVLKIRDASSKIGTGLAELIKDEVNVKKILFNKGLKQDVELDTTITKQLKEEGLIREIIRSIQGMRKEAGYEPKDRVNLSFEGDEELQKIFSKQKGFILRAVGARMSKIDSPDIQKDVDIEGKKLHFSITKG